MHVILLFIIKNHILSVRGAEILADLPEAPERG